MPPPRRVPDEETGQKVLLPECHRLSEMSVNTVCPVTACADTQVSELGEAAGATAGAASVTQLQLTEDAFFYKQNLSGFLSTKKEASYRDGMRNSLNKLKIAFIS